MSRRNSNEPDFGGPKFKDWAFLGVSSAVTAWCGNRIYKKHQQAKARRRSWEEEYDPNDVVYDYDSGYYLR